MNLYEEICKLCSSHGCVAITIGDDTTWVADALKDGRRYSAEAESRHGALEKLLHQVAPPETVPGKIS